LSQWMGQAAGLASVSVGVILIPLSAISIILARIVSTRGWVRIPLMLGGLSLVAAGTILFFVTHDAAWLIILLIAVSILFGAANGLANLANQTALYMQAPAADIGVSSGLFRTFAYIGAIFSSSLIGLTFGARASDAGLHTQAIIIAALGLFLALLALDRMIPISALRDSQKSEDKNA
jgi:MFS family permease